MKNCVAQCLNADGGTNGRIKNADFDLQACTQSTTRKLLSLLRHILNASTTGGGGSSIRLRSASPGSVPLTRAAVHQWRSPENYASRAPYWRRGYSYDSQICFRAQRRRITTSHEITDHHPSANRREPAMRHLESIPVGADVARSRVSGNLGRPLPWTRTPPCGPAAAGHYRTGGVNRQRFSAEACMST